MWFKMIRYPAAIVIMIAITFKHEYNERRNPYHNYSSLQPLNITAGGLEIEQ